MNIDGTARARSILSSAIRALERATGVRARWQRTAGGAVIEVETGRGRARFRPQVKIVDRFETPALIKTQGKSSRTPPLLVAPYITRRVAERCRQLHLPFIDAAGNAYLEQPGLFVCVVGQSRPADAGRDRFRALSPAGLRVAFALLCRANLIRTNYREIALLAGVALGTVGPVIDDLAARGLLRLGAGRSRALLDPERLVEEWVTHYPVTLRPKLNPRRFQADPERLQKTNLIPQHAYWGAEPAAEKLTQFLKPAHLLIYAREPIANLVAAGRLRAAEQGNVEILDTFWNFAVDKGFPDVVPPLLAYADLLATHDGRNAEAARMIYEQRIAPAFGSAKPSH